MRLEELRSSLLKARDRRQALLDGLFPTSFPTTVMLSLNLPGEAKTGAHAERLFRWGEKALLGALEAEATVRGSDELGPFALYRTSLFAAPAKRLGIALETMHPAGRLLDLDVYDQSGRPLSRSQLEVAPRSCLVCPEPALSCIRAGRHSTEELALRAKAVIDAL